jgi:hypothetical protein
MGADFAPDSAALPAVELSRKRLQLAFGEPRLTPIQPFSGGDMVRGLTPVIDFHPMQLIRAQLLNAC